MTWKKGCLATKRLQSEKMPIPECYAASTMKNTKRFCKHKTNGISDMHENTEKNQRIASIKFFHNLRKLKDKTRQRDTNL